jgi:hypothetical protein
MEPLVDLNLNKYVCEPEWKGYSGYAHKLS